MCGGTYRLRNGTEGVACSSLLVQKPLVSDPRNIGDATLIQTYVPPLNNTKFSLQLNRLCVVSNLVIKLTAFQHTFW